MEESAEVKSFYLECLRAIANGDVQFVRGATSKEAGVMLIGTDPNEWWSGYDRIVSVWQEQFDAMGGSFPIKPGDPKAFQDGNVGWIADQPTMAMPDGSDFVLRLTMVAHREDGEWKIAQ